MLINTGDETPGIVIRAGTGPKHLTDAQVDALPVMRRKVTAETLRRSWAWGHRAGAAAWVRYAESGKSESNAFEKRIGMQMHEGWEAGYRG